MKKWMLYICCFLPFWGWSDTPSEKSELNLVEQEIQTLKNRLQQDQFEEMKEEVEGQGLMIADWEAYAKELQLIRKHEEEENQIKLQIQKLEQRKARLLSSQTQSK